MYSIDNAPNRISTLTMLGFLMSYTIYRLPIYILEIKIIYIFLKFGRL
jgi:hypothetical protein